MLCTTCNRPFLPSEFLESGTSRCLTCNYLHTTTILQLLESKDVIPHLERFLEFAKTPLDKRTVEDWHNMQSKYIQILYTDYARVQRIANLYDIPHFKLLLQALDCKDTIQEIGYMFNGY